MNEQEQAWASEFGDAYTLRNRVNWLTRVPFWTEIIALTGADSVLEVGCNFGANLLALRTVKPSMNLLGLDVNESALKEAGRLGLQHILGRVQDRTNTPAFDLVFTCGMLIHVPPTDLGSTMTEIVNLSRRWVLAVEYLAKTEEEVEYRGKSGLLWKRPFGEMYEALGLKIVMERVAGKDDGFDNCNAWLMEKP